MHIRLRDARRARRDLTSRGLARLAQAFLLADIEPDGDAFLPFEPPRP